MNLNFIRDMKTSVKQYFENMFFSFLQSDKNKKLSMYKDLKQLYEIEPYITYIEDPFIRKDITKFWISAHMLKIEKGRYNKIERNNSVCLICNHGEIEDGFHFMMECSKYRELRNEYLYPILLHVNQGQILSQQDMFVHILMSRDKDIVMNVANFI